MLKGLIETYGKQKINTLTKYPSILTLHKIGEKGRLMNEFTTSLEGETMYATEKIDGTNVRIICWGDEYLIGSRDFILHHNHDLYFDQAQGIVEAIKQLQPLIPNRQTLSVIYGELYGGKVSSNSKWYGQDKMGFRVFDVANFYDMAILEKSLPEISTWRERETDQGIIYGQRFQALPSIIGAFPDFELVPEIEFELGDMSHETILNNLKKYLPETNVALSDKALKRAEGIVLRNASRTKIVKLRFEDYERTLRK